MSSNTNAVPPAKPSSSSSSSSNKVTSASSTGRPSLKNLSRARVPKHAMIGVAIATASAVAWQVLVSNRHKSDIANFYKTYDPERDYARMKAAGVFKSLAGRERPEWLSEYESELDSAIASLKGTAGSNVSQKSAAAAAANDQ